MNKLTAISSPKGGRAIVAQGKLINYRPSPDYMTMRICSSIKKAVAPPLPERIRKHDDQRFAVDKFFPNVLKHFKEKYGTHRK